MTITIGSTTVNASTNFSGSTCRLRIYSSHTFTASDGTPVMAGTPGSGNFFKEVSCTIAAGVISIPSFTIPSTTDGIDNFNARYTAVFFDSRNVKKDVYFDGFQVPITYGATVTWAQLRIFKAGRHPIRDLVTYTKQQVDALIALAVSGSGAPKMTDVIYGIGTLDVPAADAAAPEAVGSNSPLISSMTAVTTAALPAAGTAGRLRRVTDAIRGFVFDTGTKWINALMGNICIEEYATLAAMIAEIGATQRTVYVPNSFACAANATIPSNITLKFTGQGSLALTTGVTVIIQGVIEAPCRQIFTNALATQGTISLSGNKVQGDFNVEWWGGTGDNSTDNTAAILAADAAMQSGNGGTLHYSTGTYRTLGQVPLANDGAATPTQKTRRWIGKGALFNGQGGAPNGGTIIDMRFSGSPAKIDTRGLGLFEIGNLTLSDGGSADGTAFIQTTNTTIGIIGRLGFYGNTANTPTQDAIVLGGTSTVLGGGVNAPFQGYGTVVERCYFNRIRYGVYGRTYCNAVVIRDNTWWTQCGGIAAIAFDAGTDSNAGNVIVDNLIEVNNYTYALETTGVFINNTVGPNNCYDPTGASTAIYHLQTLAVYNLIIDGFRSDIVPLVLEAGTAVGANTLLTSHQSQTSLFPQPVDFTNVTNRFINANGKGPTIQRAGANNLFDLSMDSSTTLTVRYTPSGGSVEQVGRFGRDSATVKRFELFGSVTNIFTSQADTRVTAADTFSLFLGTASVPNVVVVTATGVSVNGGAEITTSNATGTGNLVKATSPTIVTPTIASFANATHNHTNAAGGGQLTIAAFSSSTGTGAVVGATSPALTTPDIGAATGASLAATGAIRSSGTAGVGYATGAGGTVTQATDKSTGVTLNKVTGEIVTNNASLAAGVEVSFVVTNSTVAATDVPAVAIKSGGTLGAYSVQVSAVGAGSFTITISNLTAGALGEALTLSFVVFKGVAS